MNRLIGFSRSLGEGDTSPLLEVEEGGEIGELAVEMRKLGSLEANALRLREASERVVADLPAVIEDAVRVRESFTSQAQVMKDTGHGLASVAETVRGVARDVGGSLSAAKEGGEAVEASLETIQKAIDATTLLEERTSRIEEVVALIGDVSDQTELLSLNAAIEAARAEKPDGGSPSLRSRYGSWRTEAPGQPLRWPTSPRSCRMPRAVLPWMPGAPTRPSRRFVGLSKGFSMLCHPSRISLDQRWKGRGAWNPRLPRPRTGGRTRNIARPPWPRPPKR